MVRVKRGTVSHKRRKRVFEQTKGYRWERKSKYATAKDALEHALVHSYFDRKKKKANFRALWQTQISAFCQEKGISYSKFIHGLKKNKIELNRKILAQLAKEKPEIMEKIVKTASK